LKIIINEHQIILKLTRKIDDIFTLFGETHFIVSNLTMGVAGYALIIVSECLFLAH
jgi:hypothetical protein